MKRAVSSESDVERCTVEQNETAGIASGEREAERSEASMARTVSGVNRESEVTREQRGQAVSGWNPEGLMSTHANGRTWRSR